MKPSILVVMLDFLVCSLLLFVIGTGGKETRSATTAPQPPAVHEAFAPAAIQAQQEEWNREYEQQAMMTQLNTQTTENEQLRSRLEAKEQTVRQLSANVQQLTTEKTQVEQQKQRVEESLTGVAAQLNRVSEERKRLAEQGQATKEQLEKTQSQFANLQGQQMKLQQEQAELRNRAKQLDQTVASQQSTINSLTEGVLAGQARLESQFNDFANGQQQMASTLQQLDTFARTLPATIQTGMAGVHQDQQGLMNNLAALAENVKGLQAGLNAGENGELMDAVTAVARGQQGLREQLDTLIRAGQTNGIARSLGVIQAGQDALRQQTAKLSDQIESIKARGPGPFLALKSARLEMQIAITKRDADNFTTRFKGAAYPPVVKVNGKLYLIAHYQSLGFAWGAPGNVTELQYTVSRRGEPAWSTPVTAPACVLRADPRVVAMELDQLPAGMAALELADPAAVFQSDQRKLHIFKSTLTGLSFEADATPDLADSRYVVVKRPLRGVASWFENPSYRPDAGDYMVTADGKLVGIMISREKCFVLSRETLGGCALSVPLTDFGQFQRVVAGYPKIK